MTHICQEFGFVAAGYLQLATLLLDLVEEPGVLDRQYRLGGEGLQKVHRLLRERTLQRAAYHQRTEHLVFAQERHREQSPKACPLDNVAQDGLRLLADVWGLDGLAPDCRLANH